MKPTERERENRGIEDRRRRRENTQKSKGRKGRKKR